jgi:hypothetical protein
MESQLVRIRTRKTGRDLERGSVGLVVDALSMEKTRQSDWMQRVYFGLSSCVLDDVNVRQEWVVSDLWRGWEECG